MLRVCNVHNVALATNLVTADLVIQGLARALPIPRQASAVD